MLLPSGRCKRSGSKSWILPDLRSACISVIRHFGKEAAVFTGRMVEGKRVRLEFDSANAARAHKDSTQQRRTLAYVFLEDDTLLNAEIIKYGYGFAYTRFPFARMDEFRRFEREARDQGLGVWALQ